MTITVELPLETGELIDKALDRAKDSNAIEHPEFAGECWSAQQADAFVTIASAYLGGFPGATTSATENYQVTVHVDQSALASGRGRSGLPIESVKRLCCDSDAKRTSAFGQKQSVERCLRDLYISAGISE